MNLEQVEHIAKKLNVSNEEVIDMNRRMTNHDQSLNAPIGKNEGESGCLLYTSPSPRDCQ